MGDIEKLFGTKIGNGILNTTILMMNKLFLEIDKKEELRALIILSITCIRR